MDAVKFIEEHKRLCKMYANCSGCPANDNGSRCKLSITMGDEGAKQVELIEEWSAARPRKTRQSVFLEQYPEADIDANGLLTLCPAPISHSHRLNGGGCRNVHKRCEVCRREFWMQEVE